MALLIAPTTKSLISLDELSSLVVSIPGVSNNKKTSSTLIHCLCLVIPASLPTFTLFLFLNKFIRVDLPVFGTPNTIILIIFVMLFLFEVNLFTVVMNFFLALALFKFKNSTLLLSTQNCFFMLSYFWLSPRSLLATKNSLGHEGFM